MPGEVRAVKRQPHPERQGQGAAAPAGARPRRGGRWKRWLVLAAVAAGVAVAAWIAVPYLGGRGGPPAPPDLADAPVAPPAPAPPGADAGIPPGETPQSLRAQAIEVVAQLVADFPRSSDPLALMGMIHNHYGESDEAAVWWRKCIDMNPKRADAYMGLARLADAAGDSAKAEELWRKAQEANPREPGAYSGFAEMLLDQGRNDEAVTLLQKQLKNTPNDARSFQLLGQACTQRREYAKAMEHYLRAADLQPDDSRSYYGLAKAYARLGQKEKADECAEKFKVLRAGEDEDLAQRKKLATDLRLSARILAEALASAGAVYIARGNAARAEQYWLRAQALDPRGRKCRQYLAGLYRSKGRLREALEVCEQLRALSPYSPLYHLNTGAVLAELGQYDAAEEATRKAVALAPKHAAGYRALARLLLACGRSLPEAKTLAEQAVALEPSAMNYAVLAEACRRNGDVAGARAALEQALRLEPGNPQIRKAYEQLPARR